ncbi:DNA-binding transcriptional regulator, LysR family [Sporobacter termitidis DSM 10068]|uniref:DNA-binding transcriptional regulator, LysR family n=1 Tax=Sporobacter termitidis DSM 10068 TaxID=1123282 RepID=A0A1M5UC48_9FIRM|nr:LysR family transcriptional regulator [Sporobacter termitidis]SHH60520.1 DNA-binding transcriptional regulator, LysR family [Sporobacter termitidis DSM 10068]
MYNVNFKHLEAFLTVAERLNVSAAAGAMRTSQSSLSKMIQRLEDGLGLTLFVRTNRGLAMTREGEFLYTKLKPTYNNICKNIQVAREMKKSTLLRIGYPSTYDASEDYDKLKKHIDGFSSRHPEIELDEILFDFMELKQALVFGDIDVALIHDFQLRDASHLSMKKVCRVRMCLAMSAKHPLAAYDDFRDIDKQAFEDELFYMLVLDDEVKDKESIAVVLDRYGIHPKDVLFTLNFQSLMRTMRQGRGMCVCGYFPNAPGREEIKFLELPPMAGDPYLTVAWRTNDITKEAQDFIDMLPDDPEEMTVFRCREVK